MEVIINIAESASASFFLRCMVFLKTIFLFSVNIGRDLGRSSSFVSITGCVLEPSSSSPSLSSDSHFSIKVKNNSYHS